MSPLDSLRFSLSGTILHSSRYFAVSPLIGWWLCLHLVPKHPRGVGSPIKIRHCSQSSACAGQVLPATLIWFIPIQIKCPDFPLPVSETAELLSDTMCSIVVMLHVVLCFKQVHYFYANKTVRHEADLHRRVSTLQVAALLSWPSCQWAPIPTCTVLSSLQN